MVFEKSRPVTKIAATAGRSTPYIFVTRRRGKCASKPASHRRPFLERSLALWAVVDHIMRGRSDECRGPTDSELRATRVIRLPITETSAKVRMGGPVEEPDDLALPYWGGHIPIQAIFGDPIPDVHVAGGVVAPAYPHSSPS